MGEYFERQVLTERIMWDIQMLLGEVRTKDEREAIEHLHLMMKFLLSQKLLRENLTRAK